MSNRNGRVTEHEVSAAVLRYLSDYHPGEGSIEEIVEALPRYLDLSDADRQMSATRPNEELWEQQVRNIVSHRDTAGNAIYDGLLEYIPKDDERESRLRITDAGHVAQQRL